MEIHVTIAPDGTVTVHVQGITGVRCVDATRTLLDQLGGPVLRQEWTMEAYQSADPLRGQEWVQAYPSEQA